VASPLLKLDGQPLFEGNRTVELEPWLVGEWRRALDGTAHLDAPGTYKRRIRISWDYLPASGTASWLGRDDLIGLALDSSPHTLEIGKFAGGYESLSVLVVGYSDRVIDRYPDNWGYEVHLELEEV